MIPVAAGETVSYADIRLTAGSLLTNCDELEIAIKPEFTDAGEADINSLYNVYLLLGTKYSEDTKSDETIIEELNGYPCFKPQKCSNFISGRKSYYCASRRKN